MFFYVGEDGEESLYSRGGDEESMLRRHNPPFDALHIRLQRLQLSLCKRKQFQRHLRLAFPSKKGGYNSQVIAINKHDALR